MRKAQKEQAAKDGKPYYDNDLVVAKPDGAPIAASWVSSQFGKLLEDLDMPHIRFHDLRHPYVKHKLKNLSDYWPDRLSAKDKPARPVFLLSFQVLFMLSQSLNP